MHNGDNQTVMVWSIVFSHSHLYFLFVSPDCNLIEMKPLDSNNALSTATSTHNAVGGQSMELGGSGPKPGSKVVYVFTTEMANK